MAIVLHCVSRIMPQAVGKRPSAPLMSILEGRTLPDLKPPVFGAGTPAPHLRAVRADVIPIAKPRAIAEVLASRPDAIEMREIVIEPPTQAVPRDAVMQAVARIESQRTDGRAPQAVAASAVSRQAAKLVVSTYRLLGFGILSMIVIVLLGYIATTVFFFLSHSWIVPTVISPTDEKVVALQGEMTNQLNARDKLANDLADADRAVAAEQSFQIAYAKAIKTDLDGRQAALARVQALAVSAAATRRHIHEANNAFAVASRDRMATELQAGLIDRDQALAGKFQLAQISGANLNLAERQAEYETQARDLGDATRSLDALLDNKNSDTALSYDVLKIKRDYDASRLALAKAQESRATIAAALARQDALIASLGQSAYLRAIADKAVVAVVPYDNLGGLERGKPLYGCKLGMVFCHQVGSVLEVLPGEVSFKHPHRDKELRGRMIEVRMTDDDASQDDVLFVGRAPLVL